MRLYCIYKEVFNLIDIVIVRMKKSLLVFLTLVLSLSCFAGSKQYRPYVLRNHEIALSGAFAPGQYSLGYSYISDKVYEDFSSAGSSYGPINGLYESSKVYRKQFTTGTWSVQYVYNFTKVLGLKVSLSYEGGWSKTYSRLTDKSLSCVSNHFLTPMVGLRVSWLNRGLVRMYSGIEAGVAAEISGAPHIQIAGQVTAVGLSLGTQIFGFVELGAGCIYMGGCVGVGYRF